MAFAVPGICERTKRVFPMRSKFTLQGAGSRNGLRSIRYTIELAYLRKWTTEKGVPLPIK